jgi:site-specific DNA recombinase
VKFAQHGSNVARASSAPSLEVVAGLTKIVSGSVTDVQQIATRQKCSVRQVNVTISLAFLAPALVRAAVEGRLPRGIGVERLRDAPAEWSRQFEALGLNPR